MAEKGPFARRLSALKRSLSEEGLDGAVVVPGPNMQYFTGVESLLLERPFMLLVPVSGSPQLVAPALEAGPYARSLLPMSVHKWTDSEGSSGALDRAVSAVGEKGRWGVEGKVPFLFLHKLMTRTSHLYEDAEPILQSLRERKDEGEVLLLKRAARMLSRSFSQFPDLLGEGVSERELAKKATEIIYSNGATKVDAMLVQSGWRAADPHGLPTSKKVKRGESVIFDVGSTFEGYYADVTRTLCVGNSKRVEDVYLQVLEAETRGIEVAAGGVRVGDVDGAARGSLRKARLADFFIHRTGHGLGLEVHEAPYIVEGGKERLASGMCFTVEPGVYIKGELGVRIEDDVLIEGKRGVELTDVEKEYGWWR